MWCLPYTGLMTAYPALLLKQDLSQKNKKYTTTTNVSIKEK